MANIHDSAHALEKDIRNSEEFRALETVFAKVMNDPTSKEMFETFRDTQLELQEKQMQGVDISEEEIESARKVVEAVQEHEDISQLMEAEQQLNVVINDISRIITKPLEELYGDSAQ